MVLIWRGDGTAGEVAGEVDGQGRVHRGRAVDGAVVGQVDREGVVRAVEGERRGATVGRVDESGEVWIGEPWQETFLGEVGRDGRVWLGDRTEGELVATCDPPDAGAGAAALLLLRPRAGPAPGPSAAPAAPGPERGPIDVAGWAWHQLDAADRALDEGDTGRAAELGARVLAACAPITGGRPPDGRVDMQVRLAWMKACNLCIEHGPGPHEELVIDLLEEAEILAGESLRDPSFEVTRLQLLLNLGLSAGRPDIAEQAIPFLEELRLDPVWTEHVARTKAWVEAVRAQGSSPSAQTLVAEISRTAEAVAELVVAHAAEEEQRQRPSEGGLAEHRRWIEGVLAEEVRQRRELGEALAGLHSAVHHATLLAETAGPEDREVLEIAVAHGQHVLDLRRPRLDEHDQRIAEVQAWLDEHPLF